MDDDLSGWETRLGVLSAEQRQHLVQWIREEQEGWAEREEEWQKVQELMFCARKQTGTS